MFIIALPMRLPKAEKQPKYPLRHKWTSKW